MTGGSPERRPPFRLAARDVQGHRDVDQAPQREHDALEGSRRKPLQLGPDGVPAGRQRRNHELAASSVMALLNVVGVDVLRRDRGSGEHRGRLIDDRPRQIRRRRARLEKTARGAATTQPGPSTETIVSRLFASSMRLRNVGKIVRQEVPTV